MKRTFPYIITLIACLGCFSIYAQSVVRVTGTVVEKEGRGTLPGVTIATGTPPKTIGNTSINGTFTINVAPEATLVFSYVGFVTQTVKLKPNQTTVNVYMESDKRSLQEVVIRGYQKRSKEITTGASTTIGEKAIQDVPVSNVEQLLQGKVAGLNIQVNTGAPGFRGSIQIRGLSSLSVTGSGSDSYLQQQSPLYIIDGVPLDADKASEFGFQTQGPGISPTSLIPPEDIQSIEILKDAQATSLYGSRGAYGVIIITTKRGNSVVPRVRYSTQAFVNSPPKLRETIGGNAERQLKIQQILKNKLSEADLNRLGYTPFISDSLNAYFNNSVDWQSVFYQTTYNQTHNIAIDGGNQTFNYKTNLGYYTEKGVIKNTGFDRYSVNMNMEYKPNNKFRFFGALFGAVGEQSKGDGVGLLQKGVARNGQASSLLPPPSFYQATSSVVSALKTANNNNSRNLRANVEGRYEFVPGLALSSNVSYDYTSDTEDSFRPAAANNQFASVYGFTGRNYTLYNRNNLSYAKNFGSHEIFINAFNEIYKKARQANVMRQEKTANDQLQGPVGYDAYFSRGGGVLDNYRDERIASFAGAFSYNFKKKYIVDLSYRLDGTSLSGMENPYSKNPSVGLRWNFSKEDWMQNLKWLDNAGLRLSWGKNISPNGNLQSIYGLYNVNGSYNNNPSIGVDYDQIPNPRLKPTTTVQYNLGFDASLFNSRFEVNFDTYFKQVENMLIDRPLANITGFNKVVSNDAAIANYGYELALTVRPFKPGKNWNFSLSANGALNRDVLTKLPLEQYGQFIKFDEDARFLQHLVYRVGRNTLSNYLRVNQGTYATDADVPVDPVTGLKYRTGGRFFEAGDPNLKDVNGDYILDGVDYEISGNSQPLFTGGLSTNITYKNWGLNVYASYTAKRTILNNALSDRLAIMRDPFALTSVVPLENLNIWTQAGDIAKYPNPYDYARYDAIQPFRKDQTLWAEEGSYFKVNSFTLSYAFNKEAIRKIGLYNLRVHFTANNLTTFSSYSGPNPENVNSLGRDNSDGYPVPRTFSIGLNMELNSGK
ncbi:SusC/RagA family TonB-linked outer membrane protein [Desertivirga arenae]|uniref:SusC/RagA family TonB-linked outer membrane protein n=1 Tax=Desertivirga arenae TaxID=2810309 RepID=UPI001A979B5E|nr:SusC/RagA family TonB-linked outer membrane protein [Pedobacter sp. SYSU D00823]